MVPSYGEKLVEMTWPLLNPQQEERFCRVSHFPVMSSDPWVICAFCFAFTSLLISYPNSLHFSQTRRKISNYQETLLNNSAFQGSLSF